MRIQFGPLSCPSPATRETPLNTSPQEALIRSDSPPILHIEYEILLSSTYQVPVLYFTLHRNDQGPIGLDGVYQYLVPESYKTQLKSVGVMGGISFGVSSSLHPLQKEKRNEVFKKAKKKEATGVCSMAHVS